MRPKTRQQIAKASAMSARLQPNWALSGLMKTLHA
jgi:hypothetical protein